MNNRNSPVYFKLVDYLSECKHHDANYDIAISLMEHIDEFPNIFIEQIAFYAHTSLSTVTKFCKRIGYPSFKGLREDISPYVVEGSNIKNTLDSFVEKDTKTTEEFLASVDFNELTTKLKHIISHQPIIILNSSYSDPFSNHLRSIFESCHYKTFVLNRDVDENVLFDLVKPSGLIIIISLTGTWLHKHFSLIETFEKQHIPYYAITPKGVIDNDKTLFLPPLSTLFQSYYHSSRYLSLLGIAIEITTNELLKKQ